MARNAALEQAFGYYDAVTKEDIIKVDGVKRASERIQRLMRAYASHLGTQASIATLKEDLKNNDVSTLDDNTINSYLEAWRKNPQYARKSDRYNFYCPSTCKEIIIFAS